MEDERWEGGLGGGGALVEQSLAAAVTADGGTAYAVTDPPTTASPVLDEATQHTDPGPVEVLDAADDSPGTQAEESGSGAPEAAADAYLSAAGLVLPPHLPPLAMAPAAEQPDRELPAALRQQPDPPPYPLLSKRDPVSGPLVPESLSLSAGRL